MMFLISNLVLVRGSARAKASFLQDLWRLHIISRNHVYNHQEELKIIIILIIK